MERNPNDNLNSQGFGATGGSSSSGAGAESGYESGSSTGGSGLGSGYGGSSGLGNSGSQGYGAGVSSEGTASSTQSFGGSGSGSFGGTADTAADKAADKAKNALGSAKEKATELKASLADKLEAGAEKLRSQQGGSYAGATGQGGVATDSGALGQVSDKLASGMKASADFLRNADLDNMKSGIEKQVKENPGRSLLIAAGLGYLLGKAFRK